MPQLGQSVSPSDDTANRDSRGDDAGRGPRRIAAVATIPTTAATVIPPTSCARSTAKQPPNLGVAAPQAASTPMVPAYARRQFHRAVRESGPGAATAHLRGAGTLPGACSTAGTRIVCAGGVERQPACPPIAHVGASTCPPSVHDRSTAILPATSCCAGIVSRTLRAGLGRPRPEAAPGGRNGQSERRGRRGVTNSSRPPSSHFAIGVMTKRGADGTRYRGRVALGRVTYVPNARAAIDKPRRAGEVNAPD